MSTQNAPRFVGLAADPQHFAEVRSDFRIGLGPVGVTQQPHCLVAVAEPVFNPAQAVGDRRFARAQLQCLLDQRACFGQADVAFGQ